MYYMFTSRIQVEMSCFARFFSQCTTNTPQCDFKTVTVHTIPWLLHTFTALFPHMTKESPLNILKKKWKSFSNLYCYYSGLHSVHGSDSSVLLWPSTNTGCSVLQSAPGFRSDMCISISIYRIYQATSHSRPLNEKWWRDPRSLIVTL